MACAFSLNVHSQAVGPPTIHCISVNAAGDVTITWDTPPDPSGTFNSYQIYTSPVFYSPAYALVTTVNTYTQTTYTQSPTNATVQAQYYYIKTISGGGANSISSDTARSIFLNIGNATNGKPPLTWNSVHFTPLPTSSPTFTLSREYPPAVWTDIYVGPNLSKIDTISICSVYYNYKITNTDAIGCISQSNINGGLFHDLTPPNLPAFDSVSVNADGSVTIGWGPSGSADAVRYVIYKDNGFNTPIDTVNGRYTTSYTYTNSTSTSGPETFRIAVMDSCKNISPLININQTTIFLSLKYDFCSRTGNLNWTNYGNLPNGILKYKVYSSVNGGPYTVIGTTTTNSFSQTNLNPGDTYCYYVKVVNTGEGITANSNVKCLLATVPQGPAYAYISSVSVNESSQVEIHYIIDHTHTYKGAAIFKSKDGITYSHVAFQGVTTATLQTYIDKDVSPKERNYYYKIQVIDSCGNPGIFSNTSKTVLLHVSNDNANVFYNTLTWDDYSSWAGVIESYNVYRAINGVFDPVAITNVPYGTRLYVDDVQNFTSDQGKFSYYVEAVEGSPSIYVFRDKARSNIADAYVEVTVFVPNAFCPNGLNKVWLPIAQYVEKTDYKVTVFDRWGTKVFETSDDTQGWDGKGTKDEVFVYLIEYKNARGEFIQLKGHLTLIK